MTRHALVTGGAGFIGSHLVDHLLAEGWRVSCIDAFNDFYDPAIKRHNIAPHLHHPRYTLLEADIRDPRALDPLDPPPDVIIHLAARAGVRPSLADPLLYQSVNVAGTQALLEYARHHSVPRFIFASSSSVYGVNPRVPWREDDHVLAPISPYASTKVSGELLGHVYSHLYGLRFIALRFFTVYGPRQRPDLAIHKFARLLRAGLPLPVYGDGSARRDFTYIDDIVAGLRAAIDLDMPYAVINLGHDRAVSVLEMIQGLERALGLKARLDHQPAQPGDVPQTWACLERARELLAYAPSVDFDQGLARFAAWLDDAPPPRAAS